MTKVGVPKEILDNEYRVALTVAGAHALVGAGHQVFVEKNAGVGSGITDEEYKAQGCTILPDAPAVFEKADLVLKVKEPQEKEVGYLRKGQVLFTYLHLAAHPKLATDLAKTGATCIAYETVQMPNGALPLLTPMSEIAGRLATQIGANYLERPMGGRGVLLGGVPGVEPGTVVIIGGGVVGTNAAKIALGLGAKVTIFDLSLDRLRYLDDIFNGQVRTVYSVGHYLQEALVRADLVIGAVLIPGKQAPRIITKDMLKTMKEGSVIVDVSVDQGGCIETIHATKHSNPTYVVDGVLHYGVANIPGAVPWTSTRALTNATMSYALKLANKGYDACLESSDLMKGVNIHNGEVVHPGVLEAVNAAKVTA
ncbi:MAG: alanine dehydrogenase [Cyanobacteria bacterium TGS_CYA1]|nr:alanine dehydrogenase [Cyanobacteria bacterium TGS_CYA1]MDX2108041.1 alanine dehydrogenase [Candidatus Melainabacteria bacterium]